MIVPCSESQGTFTIIQIAKVLDSMCFLDHYMPIGMGQTEPKPDE